MLSENSTNLNGVHKETNNAALCLDKVQKSNNVFSCKNKKTISVESVNKEGDMVNIQVDGNTSKSDSSNYPVHTQVNGNTSQPSSSSNNTKSLWTDVVRRRPKRVVVVGSNNENSITNKLQGVPKTVSLHVYRLAPGTKAEQLTEFLKPDYPEVTCEVLASRHPELYASFKITIFEENAKSVMDPNIWPKNMCVRYFLVPRQKVQNPPG